MISFRFDAGAIARMARLSSGGHVITQHLAEGIQALEAEAIEAVRSHMNFTRGYSTGALEASVRAVREEELSLRISAERPYAAFVEYGTRRMAAEPYMRPGLAEMRPVFEQYMSEAVEHGLHEMAQG